MPDWTTGEIRKLKEAHISGKPKRADLPALLPRHSLTAICCKACNLGLRAPKVCKKPNTNNNHYRWLRIAHLHFSNRETEIRGDINGRR